LCELPWGKSASRPPTVAAAVAIGNPGAGWQLNNSEPPLPSASNTTNGTGTMHLSMPDATNAAGASATAAGDSGLPRGFSSFAAGGPAPLDAGMPGVGPGVRPTSSFAGQLSGGGLQL
jgi:hypothetical protein